MKADVDAAAPESGSAGDDAAAAGTTLYWLPLPKIDPGADNFQETQQWMLDHRNACFRKEIVDKYQDGTLFGDIDIIEKGAIAKKKRNVLRIEALTVTEKLPVPWRHYRDPDLRVIAQTLLKKVEVACGGAVENGT